MMNQNCIWVISTLTVLILTACNNSSTPNTTVSPNTTASPSETTKTASNPEKQKTEAAPEKQKAASNPEKQKTEAASPTTDKTQAGFTGLKKVVAQTQSAVESNDFAKAKQEFGEFEEYWEKVEDGVKTKSAATYKAIENDMDNIKNGLRAPSPDKAKVLADLQSLSKILNSYQ